MWNFIKKAIIVWCLFWLAVILLIVGGMIDDAHAADSRPCVTKTEYRAVKDEWRQRRVTRVFDTRGRVDAWIPGIKVMRYKKCGGGFVDVYYYKKDSDGTWRVYDKLVTQ